MTKDDLIDKLIAERDDLALQLELQTEAASNLEYLLKEREEEVSAFLRSVTPEQFNAIPRGRRSWRERGFSKNQATALAILSALWRQIYE